MHRTLIIIIYLFFFSSFCMCQTFFTHFLCQLYNYNYYSRDVKLYTFSEIILCAKQ